MLVYCPHITARHRYILQHVLGYYYGLPVSFTENREEYLSHTGPSICYHHEPLGSGMHLYPHGLLDGEEVTATKPEQTVWKSEKVLFPVPGGHLPFDLFAMGFYLLTRYEEYPEAGAVYDDHGRYRSAASLAAQTGNLHRPWFDHVLEAFRHELRTAFPTLVFKKHAYLFQPTFDIDMAYVYRGKPYWRQWLGVARDLLSLRLRLIYQRASVWAGRRSDPNDTYSVIRELHDGDRLIFFLLLGNYSDNDKNLPWKHPYMKALAAMLRKEHIIGIHPSYYSSERQELFFTEVDRAARLAGEPVSRSRQHYLRMRWPSTFEHLELSGIRHDYTMGYPDVTGFRASTAHPFPFFNLHTNTRSTLYIHPFMVMDVTLRRYEQRSPEEAIREVEQLVRETRQVNGQFISLWHNDSLSNTGDWAGWVQVYQELIRAART